VGAGPTRVPRYVEAFALLMGGWRTKGGRPELACRLSVQECSSRPYRTGPQGDRQTPTFERVKGGKVRHESLKFRQRVTRTRGNGGKLPDFEWLQRSLWIRRVLVRAQEGQ
jgi:hypothetical protein